MDLNQYIKPRYAEYNSVELFNERKYKENFYGKDEFLQFEKLEEKKNILIVGEPGIGKSELLRRQYEYLKNKEIAVAILDLKILKFFANPNNIYDDFFETAIEKISKKGNDEQNKIANNFDLKNRSNKTIILDGLDEIDTEYFEVTFKEIERLKAKFNNLSILVSCRSYYVEKHKYLFTKSDFEVIQLLPFNLVQISNYLEDILDFESFLKEYKNSNIIKLHGNTTFLNTPRYLRYYKELIKENGYEKVKRLSRHEIIGHVIHYRVKNEVEKLKIKRKNGSYNVELIIQVLEKVALVLEMQESNTISKEDFSQFFLESNFSLHNEISITQIQQNTVLKDSDKNLQFDNTEFQEYLAAKQISRTSKHEQVFYDLAINEDINAFKHSWLNVATYLTEIKPEFTLPIIQLGNRLDDNNLFEVVKFIKKEDLNIETKNKIFKTIHNYFNSHKLWVNNNITNVVAEFGKNNVDELKEIIISNPNLNIENYTAVGNSCIIIAEQLENNFIESEKATGIKKYLLKYLNTKTHNKEVVCRYSMHCLVEILDENEIKQIIKYYGKLSTSISGVIASGLSDKYPNNSHVINLMISDIISKRMMRSDVYVLNKINTQKGISHFLKHINKDLSLENRIYNSLTDRINNSFDRKTDLLINIEKCWNKDIENLVFNIFNTSINGVHTQYLKENKFLFHLTSILLEKNDSITKKLLEQVFATLTQEWKRFYILSIISTNTNFIIIFNYVLKHVPTSINLFISYLRNHNNEVFQLLELDLNSKQYVDEFKRLQMESSKEIEKYFRNTETPKDKTYKEYFSCLKKGHYHVIEKYEYVKNSIKDFINEADKSKLQDFIINKIFKELDTLKYMHYFEGSLYILKDIDKSNTKEILKPYRRKLIECLSFYRDCNYIESILTQITQSEIDELVNFVEEHISTLTEKGRLNYFFKFLQKTTKNINKDTLKSIIANNDKDVILRMEALKLYSKDYLELSFLEALLLDYGVKIRVNELDHMFIYEVNKILVQNDSDIAVKWLIESILINKYEYKRNENSTSIMRGVSPQEGVGKNIEYINSYKYTDQLISLITNGIKLMNKNHNYYEFVNIEMWSYFVEYCKHLELKEKEYLAFKRKLNNILEQNKDVWEINFFKYKIDTILLTLRNKISKQSVNIAATIQKYEELMKKKYLKISFAVDVFDAIKEILENIIPTEIEKGNFKYLFSDESESKKEDFYEKLLVKEIELQLLRKGFRKNDIQYVEPTIFRQIQGLNNDRTDLLVSYGTIGSVLIELKKERNTINKVYKESKLKSYMEITKADYCICLIINDTMQKKDAFKSKIEEYKQDLEDSTYLITGINFAM